MATTREKKKKLFVFVLLAAILVITVIKWRTSTVETDDNGVLYNLHGVVTGKTQDVHFKSYVKSPESEDYNNIFGVGEADLDQGIQLFDPGALKHLGGDAGDDSLLEEGDETLFIWPLPQKILIPPGGGLLAIDSDFSVKYSSPSRILSQGIARYEKLIRQRVSPLDTLECRKPGVKHLKIYLESDGEDLHFETNYEYSLVISEDNTLSIHAISPFGALYGLESFLQLVQENGCVRFSELHIEDLPKYRHRGLMLDTGHRFVPKDFLFNILDAMSYLKMNVFHWHFADWCIYSIESKIYPELTHQLSNQFYTQNDVREIVQFARARGIRVIPELDIPSHLGSLKILSKRGLKFCDDQLMQIYNDPQGDSLLILKKLLSEIASLFPDSHVHIGGEDVKEHGSCTPDSMTSLAKELIKHVLSLGKRPIGWEEIPFITNIDIESLMTQAKSNQSVLDLAAKGIQSFASPRSSFRLDDPLVSVEDAWTDSFVGKGSKSYLNKRIMGGEGLLWTSSWAPKECASHHVKDPLASWMHDQTMDETFVKSASGLLWPKGIAVAGSLWNYNSTIPKKELQKRIRHHLVNLLSRGTLACPIRCQCDHLKRCDKMYSLL